MVPYRIETFRAFQNLVGEHSIAGVLVSQILSFPGDVFIRGIIISAVLSAEIVICVPDHSTVTKEVPVLWACLKEL